MNDNARYTREDFERVLVDDPTDAGDRDDGHAPAAPVNGQAVPLGYRALGFVANGAPIGKQRSEAVAAARNYLSAGYSVGQTADAIWRGLQASPQEPGKPAWTETEALAIARDLASKPPSRPLEELPRLVTHSDHAPAGAKPRLNAGNRDLGLASAEAWNAIRAANTPPRLFLHGGIPARLEHAEGVPALRELTPERLRYEAARAADWFTRHRDRKGDDCDMPAAPPTPVIADMLAYPAEKLSLPPVDRIVHAPCFAPDGTLQATPGYHAAGRVLVCLDPDLQVPTVPLSPSAEHVRDAVALVDELFADFPLCSAADRAAAIALYLLPIVRDMIPGPTPLHLLEAPSAGTGKGLMVSVALTPGVGDALAVMAQGRDDEEWRKRLTAVLRAGGPAVFIDNLTAPLDSGALAGALTAPVWDDRVLGSSDMGSWRVRCVWVAAGNNPQVSTEIARRAVRIRLDAKQDRPWQREASSFKHPDLKQWARDNRGRLIAAALTLAQAWIAKGCPAPQVRPLGSYEAWSRVVGGILENAGIPGFLQNLDDLYERADSEGAAWRRFVGTWWDRFQSKATTVADLYPLALELEDLDLGKGLERSQKTALGMGLKRRQDMVLDGFRIVSAGKEHRAAVWKLEKVNLGEPREPFRSDSRNLQQERDVTRVGERSGKVHQGSLGSPVSTLPLSFVPSADWQEVPDGYTGPAVWCHADADQPVTVTGTCGERDGVTFYTVSESATGVPGNELRLPRAAPGDGAAGDYSEVL